MRIVFRSAKLAKLCSNQKLMRKELGAHCADRLVRQLDQLRFFSSLADRMTLKAGRCHELKGNRQGQFSVDLEHPRRLVFEPDHDPIPRKPDGGTDLNHITQIIIIEIVDTHN